MRNLILSTEDALKEVILEKFALLLDLNQKSTKERLQIWIKAKTTGCYRFFNRNSGNQSDASQQFLASLLISDDVQSVTSKSKNIQSLPWCYIMSILICASVGIVSGFIFLNTSKSAAELIIEQIRGMSELLGQATESIAEIIGQLTKYCGVETNSILGMQIMIMLAQKLYFLWNRSSSEKILTGDVNFKPWYAGTIVAVGATIPLASLDISTSKNQKEEVMGYISAITTLPACLFGGRLILSYFFPNFFSETKDDSIIKFNADQQKILKSFKNLLAGRLYNKVCIILLEYGTKNEFSLNEFKRYLNTLKQTNATEDLKKLLQCLMLPNEEEQEIKVKQSPRILTALKNIAKGSATTGIGITSLTLVINDILTAYYAGRDLVSEEVGKVILSTLASALTGLSSGGIALYSIHDVATKIWKGEINVIKETDPRKFYALAIVLIIGGLFSGGASAFAGFTKMKRLLTDIGHPELAEWIPKIFEGLGYSGAAVVSIPYCMAWAQWLIGIYSENCSDYQTRQLLTFTNNCQELTDVILNMKIEHTMNLLKEEIFGDNKTLAKLGVLESDLNTIGLIEESGLQLN